MKRKIFSVLFALVLVLSFSLVTAVPAAAQTTTYGTWYLAYSGTGGAAAWSTTQAHDDTYSAYLQSGTQTSSYGRVWKPADITLANITAVSFWHYLDSSSQLDHSSWPMFLEEGETYSDGTGYFTPYVTLKITDGTTDHWLISQQFARDPDGTWAAGWEQWQMSDNAAEYPAASGMDPAEALWHDELWTDDGGTGGSGAYPAGWEYLSYFQTTYSGYDVVELKVSVGDWATTINQTAYVDDITVAASTTQYAVEPRVFIGATPYGAIKTAIDAATTGQTINVSSGTFRSSTSPIDVDEEVTIQSVSGKATTIIDPGSSGQGVLMINAENVTIDGFTITHGTETADATHPTEHTVWVTDEYSTIKNNTILTRGGNKAGIYIGGREDPDTESLFLYNQPQPLGHTIEDNVFRNANPGEGWGIFAYELKDSLIHDNDFVGESGHDYTANQAAWDGYSEGAPSTGIVIHKASAGGSASGPGGGYVVIEDNTAQYMRYTWLTFSAHFMFVDNNGAGYERAEASTVEKVIVRNNTVSDSDVGVTLKPKKETGSPYADAAASLTIGSDLVTIGPGNNFHDVYKGVDIDDPETLSGDYYGVLDAANIVIKYNDFVDASSHGVYNGMYWAGLTAAMAAQTPSVTLGDYTIPALYNYWGDPSGPDVDTATSSPTITINDRGTGETLNTYITYEPWLHTTQATVYPSGTRYYAYNWVDLTKGWNIWSTPIAMDEQADTWGEYKALGVDLDMAGGNDAYWFNASTPGWESVTDSYVLRPCDAIYIKVASDQEAPILFSPSYSAPTTIRRLEPGECLLP